MLIELMDQILRDWYNRWDVHFELNIDEQFDENIENVFVIVRRLYDEVDIIDFRIKMMLDELIENHLFVLTIVDEFELFEEIDEEFLNN